MSTPQFYTVQEVCEILRISPSSAARGLRAGKDLPWTAARKIGRKVIIPIQAIDNIPNYTTNKAV